MCVRIGRPEPDGSLQLKRSDLRWRPAAAGTEEPRNSPELRPLGGRRRAAAPGEPQHGKPATPPPERSRNPAEWSGSVPSRPEPSERPEKWLIDQSSIKVERERAPQHPPLVAGGRMNIRQPAARGHGCADTWRWCRCRAPPATTGLPPSSCGRCRSSPGAPGATG